MPKHISFSAVSDFMKCPQSWFAKRILGEKTPAGSAANFGHRFEEAVCAELGAKRGVKSVQPENRDALVQLPDPTDPQALEAQRGIGRVEEAERAEMDRAVRAYFDDPRSWKRTDPGELIWQHEVRITPVQWGGLADVYGAHGDIAVEFLGYLDLLRTNGPRRTVLDFKTTSAYRGADPSWFLQTTLYATFVRAQTVEIHVLDRKPLGVNEEEGPREDAPKKRANSRPEFRVHVFRFYPDERSFQWALNLVGYTARLMLEAERAQIESLPATPGWYCRYCPRNSSCVGAVVGSLNEVGA